MRLVGDRALAEDLTQEVFIRVFQGLPRFSLRSKFTTWLFQVTKNRVLDELRANERRPRALVAIDDAPPLEAVDAPVEQLETIDALWSAVTELNPDLKMALLLRDVVGLSYNEIADSLDTTLATVKWRIFKAREEVQLALAREGITFAPSTKPAPAPPPAPAAAELASKCPSASRSASAAGSLASRISACVAATGYAIRRKLARPGSSRR